MSRNLLLICFVTMTCVCVSACAQSKKSTATRNAVAKKGSTPILLQATSQTIHAGREESGSTTEYRFVIVWKSSKEPSAFFWMGEQSWQPCDVTRIKNFKPLTTDKKEITEGLNYENNDPGNIAYHAGDTLELYPTTGGKHPIPGEIPRDKSNIIYYKEVNGKWMALPVNKITKLPSIAMP